MKSVLVIVGIFGFITLKSDGAAVESPVEICALTTERPNPDVELLNDCKLYEQAIDLVAQLEEAIYDRALSSGLMTETDEAKEKRKNEFMRYGKRKNEFMRYGKRKNEFMRYGRSISEKKA